MTQMRLDLLRSRQRLPDQVKALANDFDEWRLVCLAMRT
jgi:hypothetical protein